MPKVSIIIPIFNSGIFLRQCVNSILSQDYQGWELLLVDDGSTDDSANICDEYASLDSRIKVFHKLNGGVSSARNVGLSNAKGEYVTFLDADDWFEANTLSVCAPSFGETDFIRFGLTYVFGRSIDNKKHNVDKNYTLQSYLKKVISREEMLGVCTGVFRTSIFRENDIVFDESVSMGEDWQVLIKFLTHTKSVCFLPYCLYNYNQQNDGSCVKTPNFDKCKQCIEVIKWIEHNPFTKKKEYRRYIETGKCNYTYNCLGTIKSNKSHIMDDYYYIKQSIYPSLFSIIVCKMNSLRKKIILLLCLTNWGYKAWMNL